MSVTYRTTSRYTKVCRCIVEINKYFLVGQYFSEIVDLLQNYQLSNIQTLLRYSTVCLLICVNASMLLIYLDKMIACDSKTPNRSMMLIKKESGGNRRNPYCHVYFVKIIVFLSCTCISRTAAFSPSTVSSRTLIHPKQSLYQYHSQQLTSFATTKTTVTTTQLFHSPDDDDDKSRKLEDVLSRLTSGFPLFVLGAAILGSVMPKSLLWVNRGNWLTYMLASVMVGTGLTLEPQDFTNVFQEQSWAIVPFGIACQFGIMPLAASLIGRTMLLPSSKDLFLGFVLVGCSPGGTASNLVSLIAGANVALSVMLTACSTILASFVTPLLVKQIVGSTVSVSGKALCIATAQVVLLPVLLGMLVNSKAPKLSQKVSKFTPFVSVLIVALICGGVVAQNATNSVGGNPLIISSIVLLHSIGFLFGYLLPKLVYGTEQTARTISIETGMQNSALAVVLARSIGAPPLAGLPGALSATTHSCLGSLLSAYWNIRDRKKGNNHSSETNVSV